MPTKEPKSVVIYTGAGTQPGTDRDRAGALVHSLAADHGRGHPVLTTNDGRQ
jgi:hypothetical protein